MKSVRIWSFSGPYFPAFGENTERSLSVFIPNAGKYGSDKLRIGTLFTQSKICSTVERMDDNKFSMKITIVFFERMHNLNQLF